MADTAEIYQFPGRQGGQQPDPQRAGRSPQVEDGYTRIANELYEVVNNAHACPVNARHLRVIHAIIRRTYGFNKTMDALADTQLAADTGIPRNKINVAKHELLAMKVLQLSDDGRKIGINKAYGEWDFTARPERKAPESKARQNGNGVTKMVTQEVTKTGTHKRQKDTPSTDVEGEAPKTRRQRIDVNAFADQVSVDTLQAFVEHRRALRSPLTQHALKLTVMAATKAADELSITAEQAIDEAIAAGWKTVRAEWLRNRGAGKAAEGDNAPACPHNQLLAIWDDTCAQHKGKAPNALDWKGTKSADALAERWAEFFAEDGSGRYSTTEEGLEWWRMALQTIAGKQDFRQSDATIWDLFYKGRFSRAANGKLTGQGGAVR